MEHYSPFFYRFSFPSFIFFLLLRCCLPGPSPAGSEVAVGGQFSLLPPLRTEETAWRKCCHGGVAARPPVQMEARNLPPLGPIWATCGVMRRPDEREACEEES